MGRWVFLQWGLLLPLQFLARNIVLWVSGPKDPVLAGWWESVGDLISLGLIWIHLYSVACPATHVQNQVVYGQGAEKSRYAHHEVLHIS